MEKSDFQQEIYRGIESSDNFLFVISPKSVNSPYCADEVEYAQKLNKRFVTILYKEVDPKDLHPALAKVQWIDFNRYERDFYANFSELVRTLDTDREHVHNHTKWSQRALEWDSRDKSNDLLLRGSEFSIAENWLQEAEQQKKQPPATDLQKDYIVKSRNAILAAIKREKRLAIILKSLLGLVSAGFVVAIIASAFAFQQWRRAEIAQEGQLDSVSRFSLTLSQSDRKFDALIEAVRAAKQLQHLDSGAAGIGIMRSQQPLSTIQPETCNIVLTALQAAVYGEGVKQRDRLTQHTSTVYSVSFSPDGKRFATASGDGTVKLWSFNGKELQTLEADEYGVRSVAFSPDNRTLASGGGDNTIKLWSKEGKRLHTLAEHTGYVSSIAWSPDGNIIASASDDTTVILWKLDDLKLDKLMQDACDWVGDYLQYNSQQSDRHLCDGSGTQQN